MPHKALSALNKAASFIGGLFFAGMFLAVFVQIVSRFAFGKPLSWPFELSVYCYVWVAYLGAGVAASRKSHVAFDLISARMGPRGKVVVSAVCNLAMLTVLAVLAPSIASYIKFAGPLKSSAMGVPWAFLLASFPAGMGLVAINLASDITDIFRGKS